MKRALALPIVSIFALGALSVAPAVADEAPAPTDACAQQQAQYDRASAKYAELQAKYQKHKTKKNQKAKKAQAQRVEKAQARLDAQMPVDEKARRADVVVVNDGEADALRAKAAPLLRDLRQGLGRRLPNASPARY